MYIKRLLGHNSSRCNDVHTVDSEYGAPSDARAQSNVEYHPQPAAKQPIQQPVQQVQYVTHAPTFITAFPLHALMDRHRLIVLSAIEEQ